MNSKLFEYIKKSPTAFHACKTSADMLMENGYTELFEGDRILLCSDGLSNSITEQEIASILCSEGDGETKINYLIQYANIQGGDDNVTALIIEY